MPIAQMLFSFEGRLRRRDFWLCFLVLMVAHSVLFSILGATMFTPVMFSGPYGEGYWMQWVQWSPAFGIVNLLLLWPRLAVGVKRCHDRDKSGLWLLLACIPVIGWIWLFIEFGLMDGTPGPNRFGPSPKGLGEPGAPAIAT